MFHKPKKVMTLMACCSVLTFAPADATNEKGNPHLVAVWAVGSTLGFFWLEVGTSSSSSSCTGRLSSRLVVDLRLLHKIFC